MFKFVVLAMFVCAASAGIIGGYGHGAVLAAPVVAHAPIAVAHAPVAVAHAPVATSYQNSNQISVHPAPVVATHAVAAPVAVAHAPVAVVGHGFGHGYLH